jgi:hypothetical protein
MQLTNLETNIEHQTLYGLHFRNMGAPFMWILKKKYDYWWKKYGLEKTDRASKTSFFDRNWVTSLKPRRRSRPLRLVWCALKTVYFRLKSVSFLLTIVYFLLTIVYFLLTTIYAISILTIFFLFFLLFLSCEQRFHQIRNTSNIKSYLSLEWSPLYIKTMS